MYILFVSDPCSPNPCMNGGTCTVTGKTFQCACAAEFVGNTCGEKGIVERSNDFLKQENRSFLFNI